MEDYIQKFRRNSLIISILLFILSIILMIKPAQSLNFIIIGFGLIATIDGILHVYSYFRCPSEFKMFSFDLLRGILSIILGLVVMFNPEWVSSFFPILIGAFIVMDSLMRFQLALNMRNLPESNWVLMLLLAIFTAVLGILMILNPFLYVIALTFISGLLLCASSLIDILEFVFLWIKEKKSN